VNAEPPAQRDLWKSGTRNDDLHTDPADASDRLNAAVKERTTNRTYPEAKPCDPHGARSDCHTNILAPWRPYQLTEGCLGVIAGTGSDGVCLLHPIGFPSRRALDHPNLPLWMMMMANFTGKTTTWEEFSFQNFVENFCNSKYLPNRIFGCLGTEGIHFPRSLS
jgi:hypothetical protein